MLPAQIPNDEEDVGTQTTDCAEPPDGTAELPPLLYRENFSWDDFNYSPLEFGVFAVDYDEKATQALEGYQ
jgi:hypothetical protein